MVDRLSAAPCGAQKRRARLKVRVVRHEVQPPLGRRVFKNRFAVDQRLAVVRPVNAGKNAQQLARIVDYDPRHLQAIENEGQYPGMELFTQLITMFDVSVDEYIHTGSKTKKSSVRRRVDTLLDGLDDRELSVIEATINGLCKAKEPEE